MDAVTSIYKGYPVISVPITERRKFTFGFSKARAILLYLKEIQSFVEQIEQDQETEANQEPNIDILDTVDYQGSKFFNSGDYATGKVVCITPKTLNH